MREDRGRLRDILDAAKRIERYAKRGRRAFEDDELVHTWMIHHIQRAKQRGRESFLDNSESINEDSRPLLSSPRVADQR